MTTTKYRCAFCGVSQDDCDVMMVDNPPAGKLPAICGDCVRHAATTLARGMAEKQTGDLLGPIHRKDHPKWVGEAP